MPLPFSLLCLTSPVHQGCSVCWAWPLPCTRVVLPAGLPQAEFQPDESLYPSTSSSSFLKADAFGNLWVPQATSQKAVSSETHTHSLWFKRQIQGNETGCLCLPSSDKEEYKGSNRSPKRARVCGFQTLSLHIEDWLSQDGHNQQVVTIRFGGSMAKRRCQGMLAFLLRVTSLGRPSLIVCSPAGDRKSVV